MKYKIKYLLSLTAVLLGLLCFGQHASAQRFSVRSNALTTTLLTPDIGMDVVTGEHSSVSLNVFGHYKPFGLDSKLIAVQPQFRWWFGGRPLVREYIGISAMFTSYDILLKDTSHRGLAGGAGLTGGYVLPLGSRWGVEFSGGLGLFRYGQRKSSRYDSFSDLDGDALNSKGWVLLPMNVGVSFIYIIK